VVERDAAKTEGRQIIAVGRLTRMGDSDEAEVAVLISDEFQGRGLGTELMRRLLEIGRAENIRRIAADILPENFRMKNICERLGFNLAAYPDDPTLRAVIDL
jgi:acetyltransferase